MYINKYSNYPSSFICQLQKLLSKQISEILSEEIKKHLKHWGKKSLKKSKEHLT